MNYEDDKAVREKVNACIDPSRGTMVGMAFEAVYEIAAQNLKLRRQVVAFGGEVEWPSLAETKARETARMDAEFRQLSESTRKHPTAATKWLRRRISDALVRLAMADPQNAIAQLVAALDDCPEPDSAEPETSERAT